MTDLRHRVERLEHLATNAASVSATAEDLQNFPGNKNLVAGANITLTPGLGTITIAGTGGGGGSQAAIQFEDEGTPLGAAGTVDTVDFVGAGVTATRVGDAVTVTIPGGGTVPTGTGFTHITSGVQDAAAKLVNLTAATDVAANQGTTTTVFHGNAAGQGSFGPVSLTADVSGDLPYANLVPATAASRILVRGSAGGAGDWQEGTLGTGLSLSGTVLNAVGVTETDTGIAIVGGGLLGAVIDTSLISAQIRSMCTGTYDYSTASDWQLWVSPTPTSGTFTLDVWKRSFGNTAPAPGDSICAAAYPTLAGNGTDFTASGATSTWTSSLVRGDMFTVAPAVNTAGVKWWALYIPARRTF